MNLHLPDEPVARKAQWRQLVLDGGTPSDVAPAVAEWLWDRWRVLAAEGLDQAGLAAIVLGYRRELWLWLAGERTWEQWCSGLIGRVTTPAALGRDGQLSLPDTEAPVFSLRHTSIVRDGRPVVDDVTWSVRPGERWVLLGPNGSGKTTVLSVAGARLWPTSGEVDVLGHRVGRVDLRTLRPRIALVSASVVRQLRGELTAREVVVTGRTGDLETWWHEYTDADWQEADRLLDPAIGQRRWRVISEGERQQVLLARALMSRPDLLLLDEPAAGLDLGARERLVARLQALAEDPATPPVVLVTHHLEEIPPGTTHAALLRDGRILASGRLDDVLTAEAVSACFSVSVDVGCDAGRWWARYMAGAATGS